MARGVQTQSVYTVLGNLMHFRHVLLYLIMLFKHFGDLKVHCMINLLLVQRQFHTGTQSATSSRYDTSRIRIYSIIPPLHLITKSISPAGDEGDGAAPRFKSTF